MPKIAKTMNFATKNSVNQRESVSKSQKTLYICRESSTNSALFMQNKPNFKNAEMNVTSFNRKEYEKKTLGERGKNKPNSNPNKPNLRNTEMNLTLYRTKDYENICLRRHRQNKPNSNPIKANLTQFQAQNAIRICKTNPKESLIHYSMLFCLAAGILKNFQMR